MIDGRRGRSSAKAATGNGLGPRLVALGVTANQVTVAGILLAALTGTVIAFGHLWTGVVLVTVGGLMDTLDGAVAKAAGSSSRRGAFLDSVSDRIADGFIFGGVAWYLAIRPHPELALLPFAILAVGNVISYERAKAELYGWDAKGGLMERAERLILLGVALGFNIVLVPLLGLLLGLCVLTAVQRFFKIWTQATAELAPEGESLETVLSTPVAPTILERPWRPARVDSRWRDWREARAAGTRARVAASTRSRPRSRRREAPLSTRLRSVLDGERVGSRSGRPPVRRVSQRRQDGATAALRRRLGNGR
jgi:CDP-diacylglycerol--glycerol-3-phosphate 3-phosphatidyltransferase